MSEKEKEFFDKLSRWLFPELYEDGKRKPPVNETIEFMRKFDMCDEKNK